MQISPQKQVQYIIKEYVEAVAQREKGVALVQGFAGL